MAIIQGRTLDSVSLADIPTPERHPVADVREIRRSPTLLTARLGAVRVSVQADFEEATCSVCPVTPCPHVFAALVAWLKKRVPVTQPKRLELVDRLLSGSSQSPVSALMRSADSFGGCSILVSWTSFDALNAL